MKKQGLKFRNEMKKQLSLTRKRMKKATKEERVVLQQQIDQLKNTLNRKTGDDIKLYQSACEKGFCNPGCKGTIFDNNHKYPLKNDFYIKTNADYLRGEGAISGCIMNHFTF